MPVVRCFHQQGFHRVVGHALGAEVAIGRGVQGVPVGDEAIRVFVAGLAWVLRRNKGRGLGEVGRLDRRSYGSGYSGPRRRARRAGAGGPRGSLLLGYGLQARRQKQPEDAEDNGGAGGYSHPTNSTSSTQMSKAAPGVFTCH